MCRKAGISQATYFNWKKKYAGMLHSQMKRLQAALHGELSRITKNHDLCVRFMNTPGVGPVTALTFKTSHSRVKSSTIISSRKRHPSANTSGTTSKLHRW